MFKFGKYLFVYPFMFEVYEGFIFALFAYTKDEWYCYRALFSICIDPYIFSIQLFYTEFVIWDDEGGWFNIKNRWEE